MRNRMAFEAKRKYVLIPIILVIDIIFVFIITFVTDGVSFSNHKGRYQYNDLFTFDGSSINTEDIYNIYCGLYYDNESDHYNAKDFFDGVTFEAIPPIPALITMIAYQDKNNIAFMDLELDLEDTKINYNKLKNLLSNGDYITFGKLFLYRDNAYVFLTIRSSPYEYNEAKTLSENVYNACKDDDNIALFKLDGLNLNYIKEHFYFPERNVGIKIYPKWYSYFASFPLVKIAIIVLFISQFLIIFRIINKRKLRNNKKSS